jgi:hypothetical protein
MEEPKQSSDQTIHREPSVMWKFGYTDMADANARFSEYTARVRNFRGVALGRDYFPRTRWSMWVPTKQDAERMEKEFHDLFPFKNLWTEVQYNGITECRFFEKEEAEKIVTYYKTKYPKSVHSWKEGYYKVYLAMFIKKKKNDTEEVLGEVQA